MSFCTGSRNYRRLRPPPVTARPIQKTFNGSLCTGSETNFLPIFEGNNLMKYRLENYLLKENKVSYIRYCHKNTNSIRKISPEQCLEKLTNAQNFTLI